MPGGKVVVYTGLLPVTQNETALAVVMGHEIAHAIARHGNERMLTNKLWWACFRRSFKRKETGNTITLFRFIYGGFKSCRSVTQ